MFLQGMQGVQAPRVDPKVQQTVIYGSMIVVALAVGFYLLTRKK